MSLFKNFKSFDKPVKNHVVRQAHPNVSPYRWILNSPFHKITQPHEKGTFFTQGAGMSVADGVDHATGDEK
jgi:hypothetical protein